MFEFVTLYFWLALSFVVGVLANRYERSWTVWFFFSLVFTPFVCGLLVLAMGPREEESYVRLTRGVDP
jgi:biotin transporter BioY